MTEDDIAYFERRRRDCIERAGAAQDPHLAGIYRSFAVHYTMVLQHHLATSEKEAAA